VWPEIMNRKYASTKRALWLKFVHVSVAQVLKYKIYRR